ncbi:MAG: imelysin family protein [Polyangiaceae bacterium]
MNRKSNAPARAVFLLAMVSMASACGRGADSDDDQRARIEREMKAMLIKRIEAWERASRELKESAPLPKGRGWDPQLDADAIARMKKAWHEGRVAYELVEGAIAPLFPESDTATDARYDDYLATLGAVGDPDPFDDNGVVGMHGIERILWSDKTPREVVDFEQGLPGYRAASFPRTEQEAAAFQQKLAAKLVADVEKLRPELEPVRLDVAFAFHGLVDLAAEMVEKVDRASTGQEESRYAQATLRDLRANRQGCWEAYQLFRPWLQTRPGGHELDQSISAGFKRLETAFNAISGDAIPRPPEGWSTLSPKGVDMGSPFGLLHKAVRTETNENVSGSLRHGLTAVADKLNLPKVLLR